MPDMSVSGQMNCAGITRFGFGPRAAARAVMCGLLLYPSVTAAQEARYGFRWEGAGGYAVTGALAFDPALIAGRIVRETDVSCFVIEGFREDAPIGRWALGDLNEETTWRLFFDAGAEEFLVEGDGVRMPQAWNMNGRGNDCGEGGFGFNLGNLGQDLCLDNTILVESPIASDVPFPALRDDAMSLPVDACIGPDLLSGLILRDPG